MKKRTRQQKWNDRNPLKRWAHQSFRTGLKRGLIEKRPCEVCGDSESEGHHPAYDRPLHVVWLCRLHHKQAHKTAVGG